MNLSEFATEIAEQLREKMGSEFTITVEEVFFTTKKTDSTFSTREVINAIIKYQDNSL